MLSTKQRSERLTIWVVLEFPLLHRKDARCDLQVRAVAIFLVNMSKNSINSVSKCLRTYCFCTMRPFYFLFYIVRTREGKNYKKKDTEYNGLRSGT